jgi:hypothetical protein
VGTLTHRDLKSPNILYERASGRATIPLGGSQVECRCDRNEAGGYMGESCASLWIAPAPPPSPVEASSGVKWWVTIAALGLSAVLNAGLLYRGYGGKLTQKLESRARSGSMHGQYGQVSSGLQDWCELDEVLEEHSRHRASSRVAEEEPEPFEIPAFVLPECEEDAFVIENEEEEALSSL